MDGLLNLCVEYRIEIALPIVVAILIKALKASFKKFFKENHIGFRLMYFLPLILGTPMGLLLTKYPMGDRLLLGAALGGISHFIYKFITVGISSKTKSIKQMEAKNPSTEED